MANTSISIKSGANLPIARWVYLVQGASDVTRMGGVNNNVYSTAQTAYDAANALQITLGGSNLVAIKVIGKFLGGVGNITLTTNWNARVSIIGDGPDTSLLNIITLTNAAGSGFTFGTAAIPVILTGIRLNVGGINTSATGATGNGGEIAITSNSCWLGRIASLVTNAANTTGNTGNIKVIDVFGETSISSISNNLSFSPNTGTTGSIFVKATGRMFVGGFENVGVDLPGGSGGGSVYIENVDANTIDKTTTSTVAIKNCTFGVLTITSSVQNIYISDTKISNYIYMDGGTLVSAFLKNVRIGEDAQFNLLGSIQENYIIYFKQVELWNCYINNSNSISNPGNYANVLTDNEDILIRDCVIENVDSLTAQTGAAAFVLNIDGLINTCKIINSSIVGGQGGIFASVPTAVDTFSTYIEQSNDPNITINPL